MAITDAFREAVTNGDMLMIRIMMKDSLLVDLTFNEFNQMEKMTSGITDLYVEHDGREFITDKSKWNDEYMSKIMVQVVDNFSHERVDHLKEVVRYLRPVPKTQNHNTNQRGQKTGMSYDEQKARDKANGNYRPQKIAVGAVVGGAAGIAVTAVASSSIAIGAIVGAALGAGVMAVVTGGGKQL